MRVALLMAVLAVGVAAPGAVGTVIRDDRTQSDSAALGSFFPASVRVSVAGGTASGTLVASDWLLTAAHVVTGTTGVPVNAGSIIVTIDGQTLEVSAVVAHPSWNGGNFTAGVDLALLRLSAPVSGVTPVGLHTGNAPIGAAVTLAGYGAFGFAGFGLADQPGALHGVSNIYDGVGTLRSPGWSASLLLMDVDAPGTVQWNLYGSPTPTDLEGGTAIGDSGGGSIVQIDGTWQLAGVHSFTFVTGIGTAAAFGYGTGVADVSVSAHAAWVHGVIVPGVGSGAGLAVLGAGLLRRRYRE